MVSLGSPSAHATGFTRCDVDRDRDIDKLDIARIIAALGSRASSPFDPRDGDGNGRIQLKDVKICAARCTRPRSAVSRNKPPVAVGDTATTSVGRSVIIAVLRNDFDRDGTLVPKSVKVVRSPHRGVAGALQDGTVRYTPRTGFVGTDSFA